MSVVATFHLKGHVLLLTSQRDRDSHNNYLIWGQFCSYLMSYTAVFQCSKVHKLFLMRMYLDVSCNQSSVPCVWLNSVHFVRVAREGNDIHWRCVAH